MGAGRSIRRGRLIDLTGQPELAVDDVVQASTDFHIPLLHWVYAGNIVDNPVRTGTRDQANASDC
jgi:hypothetical protein